ncbi:MAG: GAF domain-containing protein [Anaerolineales bacterium]|nr:GAF domain-containing protein [Anaerolineales bacterium]
MTAAARSPESSDWRALAGLGEQLVSTTSLVDQRNRIIDVTRRLVAGEVDVWLHESLFRLPDWNEAPLFPPEPELEGMREAFHSGKPVVRNKSTSRNSSGTCAAIPLEDQGLTLGILQVSHPDNNEFPVEELDVLIGLASVISVSLFASHRVAVERFRLNQINLVHEVSAQIANVMDMDELARRVTELIQKTFKYSYVGVFTHEPGSQKLRFRSSASAPRKGRRKSQRALEVKLGQGLIGQAAQSGEMIVVDDVQADARFRFIPSLPETKSEVVLPLKIEDRVLGVIDVQSDQLQAFHPNDLLILDALAANIARAVEGAHLYTALRRRADQLALIAEVSDAVTSTLNLSEVMHKTANLIHKKFGYPFVHLFTVHPNRRQVIYEAGSGARSRKLEGYAIPLDDPQGIIPWVARKGETVLTNDVGQDDRYVDSPFPPKNVRSELCVPLLFDRRVVGVLDVQSDKLNAFTEDDRMIFEAVADNIASAIHNADLYASEQWRRQIADGLREVAVLLSANVGVEDVLDAVLVELYKTLPVDVSAIWLLEEGDLYLAAVRGCRADLLEEARQSSVEASVALMSALVSERPVIRRPDDPKWPSGLAARFEDNYSSIAAPLHVGDQPVGVLTLAHSTPGRYGHEAQAMTTTFASYAAVAIENARLYDSAQEQAYASAALLQVAQAVVSLSDLDEILSTIVRIMPILVGVERCALYLWDAEKGANYPYEEYGLSEEDEIDFWEREFPAGASPVLDAARAQAHALAFPVDDSFSFRDWVGLDVLDEDVESEALTSNHQLLLAVPLLIKNDIFGVMLVQEAPGGLRFRARRLDIINGIAQQAALAVQNDRLQAEMFVRERLEAEVELARQIQQTFIPETLPLLSGWDLAARWRTARQVGGDFYDVMELPGGRTGLFIADVADKGVPAALFMALTRTLVRASVIGTESPAEALRRVNDLLIPDTQQGMFVTAVYAVLYPESGKLVYANAGHNPPLWLTHDDKVERLTRTGMALGVIEGEKVEERSIKLKKGDNLLLYTDGLSEAFSSSGDMFGEERIISALQAGTDKSAERLLQGVEAELDEFVGDEEQSDDLTMLLLRRE